MLISDTVTKQGGGRGRGRKREKGGEREMRERNVCGDVLHYALQEFSFYTYSINMSEEVAGGTCAIC